MNTLLQWYGTWLAIISVAVGVIGTLIIILDGTIFDMDSVLTDKKDFLCCIFMYQVFVFDSKEYVNKIGVGILEILTILSVWHLNIIIFALLIFLEAIRFIIFLFLKIFGKKNDNNEPMDKILRK